jgi:5-methylcytosine-specific restriction endonuclease McrA
MPEQAYKHCTGCATDKPVGEFAKAKDRKDGLNGWCKECHRAYHRANRAKLLAGQRAYKDERRRELASKQRAYYRANKEAQLAYRRAWAEANPEKTRRYATLRMARVRAGGALSEEARAYWDILDGDICCYCGRPAGEKDHIEAASTSGDNAWDNFTAACRSCNASKSDKTLLDFLLTT